MSQKELNELRKRLEEEQQRREEAERRREEEHLRREEAEQRRREAAERNLNLEVLQTRNTTLPEFLDACHEHLFLGLTIQKDKKSSTKGDPANADRKLRPSRIQEWTSFPDEQMAIWSDLMDANFVTERHFTPLLALEHLSSWEIMSVHSCTVVSLIIVPSFKQKFQATLSKRPPMLMKSEENYS